MQEPGGGGGSTYGVTSPGGGSGGSGGGGDAVNPAVSPLEPGNGTATLVVAEVEHLKFLIAAPGGNGGSGIVIIRYKYQ